MHQGCSSPMSGWSDYDEPPASAARHSHTPTRRLSVALSESHTPSHCSATTEDNIVCEEAGPASPHPFSEWDMYKSEHDGQAVKEAPCGSVMGFIERQ